MTQILAYRTANEVVVATDSRAVAVGEGEEERRHFPVTKMFPLAPHVVMVTGGAGLGLEICRRYQAYVKRAAIWELDEIVYRALPFLQAEMQCIQRGAGYAANNPSLERLYVVLAGYRPQRPDQPAGFTLLGSNNAGEPLAPIATGAMLAVPRWMSLEFRFSRLPPDKTAPDEVERLFERSMWKAAEENDEVAPPFHFARVSRNGVRFRVVPENGRE